MLIFVRVLIRISVAPEILGESLRRVREIICQDRARNFQHRHSSIFRGGRFFLYGLDACVTATWRTRLTLNSQRETRRSMEMSVEDVCTRIRLHAQRAKARAREMQMRHFHELIDANDMIMYDETA